MLPLPLLICCKYKIVSKIEKQNKNKTYPGLASRAQKKKPMAQRRLGPFLSSWACVGHRWLLWAFVDLRWPSLAVVGAGGLRGPALALVGCCEPSLTCVGRRWPSLAVVGCCGSSWACVGLPWAAVGLRWPALAFRGLLWACVGLRWPSLGAVGLRWPSLAVVGCCGPLLTCVGLC